ncbi:MAG: Spy/CpxP family protein refolding chaperone, partial [Azoarcus sp.]|nr:Spy/CpxP family protein refolding chaperone [Azoarcus sp.]
MKTWIKTTLAASLIAATAAGAGTAFARGGDCAERGTEDKPHAQRMAPEDRATYMGEQVELKLARLELALALTPEQRPAWDALAITVRAQTGSMAERMREHRDAGRPDTAVDRIARMEQMSERMRSATGELRQSVENLYAKLSDAQKTVFDADFALPGHGRFGPQAKGSRG